MQERLVLRLADRCITSSSALLKGLLVVESVAVAVVLNLVEGSGDGMKNTIAD
jgi:hypothetical protein